jgi:Acyl-CoA synthetase (NDP forming)
LQREVVETARRTGIRILGPNTVGTVNTTTGLVTSPYPIGSKIKRGNIALAAQTGLISPTGLNYGDFGYKISKICDFGNKCDVDEIDLIEYLADDPETKVIAMEIEGIRDGRRFLDVARRVTKKKPILIFKPGRTKESARALMSHTGSLSGEKKFTNQPLNRRVLYRPILLENCWRSQRHFHISHFQREIDWG